MNKIQLQYRILYIEVSNNNTTQLFFPNDDIQLRFLRPTAPMAAGGGRALNAKAAPGVYFLRPTPNFLQYFAYDSVKLEHKFLKPILNV